MREGFKQFKPPKSRTVPVSLEGFYLSLLVFLYLGSISTPACASRQINSEDSFEVQRETMVRYHLAGRDIDDQSVLSVMREVPRHLFIPASLVEHAYADHPLPIGNDQTISQPYIVALMTQSIEPDPGDKVLEIGTGSGYQAAVLSRIVGEVYTIEIVSELGRRAEKTLKELGYDNVFVRIGDGYKGWPEEAPFDAIIVTAAPVTVPRPLIDQLADGGKMVIPVGATTETQTLKVLTRRGDEIVEEEIAPVRFVPMTGEAQQQR